MTLIDDTKLGLRPLNAINSQRFGPHKDMVRNTQLWTSRKYHKDAAYEVPT